MLDFSKASERVPHEPLPQKLDHYGVRDSTLNWIRAVLTDRVQQVTVEGATSESIQVLSGVPQGTVLGSLLFLVFINYLPDCGQSRIWLLHFVQMHQRPKWLRYPTKGSQQPSSMGKEMGHDISSREMQCDQSRDQRNQFPQHVLWKATILTRKTSSPACPGITTWTRLSKTNSTLGLFTVIWEYPMNRLKLLHTSQWWDP